MLPYFIFSTLLAATKRSNKHYVEPPDDISIVLPAYNEPCWLLEYSLTTIQNQQLIKDYPNSVEVILVDGEPCNDKLSHLYDKHVKAPKGKLRARHAGILAAKNPIIASVDADTLYPEFWLGNMVEPYSNPNTVMTINTPSAYDPFIESTLHLLIHLHSLTLASGRSSTFKKKAYTKIGGFDLITNFKSSDEMQLEEEYAFRLAMSKIGIVTYVPTVAYHLDEWFIPTAIHNSRGLRASIVPE